MESLKAPGNNAKVAKKSPVSNLVAKKPMHAAKKAVAKEPVVAKKVPTKEPEVAKKPENQKQKQVKPAAKPVPVQQQQKPTKPAAKTTSVTPPKAVQPKKALPITSADLKPPSNPPGTKVVSPAKPNPKYPPKPAAVWDVAIAKPTPPKQPSKTVPKLPVKPSATVPKLPPIRKPSVPPVNPYRPVLPRPKLPVSPPATPPKFSFIRKPNIPPINSYKTPIPKPGTVPAIRKPVISSGITRISSISSQNSIIENVRNAIGSGASRPQVSFYFLHQAKPPNQPVPREKIVVETVTRHEDEKISKKPQEKDGILVTDPTSGKSTKNEGIEEKQLGEETEANQPENISSISDDRKTVPFGPNTFNAAKAPEKSYLANMRPAFKAMQALNKNGMQIVDKNIFKPSGRMTSGERPLRGIVADNNAPATMQDPRNSPDDGKSEAIASTGEKLSAITGPAIAAIICTLVVILTVVIIAQFRRKKNIKILRDQLFGKSSKDDLVAGITRSRQNSLTPLINQDYEYSVPGQCSTRRYSVSHSPTSESRRLSASYGHNSISMTSLARSTDSHIITIHESISPDYPQSIAVSEFCVGPYPQGPNSGSVSTESASFRYDCSNSIVSNFFEPFVGGKELEVMPEENCYPNLRESTVSEFSPH